MGHILVVDDEPAIITVVRERLERDGFSVRAAASGEEALEHLEMEPADLIVLDVMLPGIDGLEVLRRLRGVLRWGGRRSQDVLRVRRVPARGDDPALDVRRSGRLGRHVHHQAPG